MLATAVCPSVSQHSLRGHRLATQASKQASESVPEPHSHRSQPIKRQARLAAGRAAAEDWEQKAQKKPKHEMTKGGKVGGKDAHLSCRRRRRQHMCWARSSGRHGVPRTPATCFPATDPAPVAAHLHELKGKRCVSCIQTQHRTKLFAGMRLDRQAGGAAVRR